MKQRDLSIDTIRSVSVLLIVLAHVGAPNSFAQYREFDVVSIVFISSLCMSQSKGKEGYIKMLKGRVKRLLIPTLILITVILAGTAIVCGIFGVENQYDLKTVVLSYLLLDGIGYIWIVRIFLTIAIFSPILWNISQNTNKYVLVTGCAAVCILGEYIFVHMPDNRIVYLIVYYYVLYVLPYLALTTLGLRIKSNQNNDDYIKIFVISSVVFVLYRFVKVWSGNESFFNLTKYPPMLDYLFYGIAITSILMHVCKKAASSIPEKIKNVIEFMSQNSFSVYFAHIYWIKIHELYHHISGKTCTVSWWIYYIVLVCTSILSVIAYLCIKGKILIGKKSNE